MLKEVINHICMLVNILLGGNVPNFLNNCQTFKFFEVNSIQSNSMAFSAFVVLHTTTII